MFLFDLLKSLDKLLYELMSWLIFYPITLWRSLRRPLTLMAYADRELTDASEEQYTDTLTPPLFLLLSLLLTHGMELAFVGQNMLIGRRVGLAALISDDTNLILFRLVVFSLFPLLLSVRLVRRRKQRVDRTTLQAPFYSQCYVTAPLALMMGIGSTMFAAHGAVPAVKVAGALILPGALIWYGIVQSLWFAAQLKIGPLRAFLQASLAMVEGLAAAILFALLFI